MDTRPRLVGAALIISALAINIPYGLLIANFDYPDVLRMPAADVLARFRAGGPSLIATWLAFAWVGAPLFFAIPNLAPALGLKPSTSIKTATTFGVVSLVAQMVGLLRWVFVVPVLAQLQASADPATRAAAEVVFQAVHQYGGVVVGEHIGQAFSCLWMLLFGVELFRSGRRVVGGVGIGGAGIYVLAQLELLQTVVPSTPVWEPAGLVGSLLWLAFLLLLGIGLLVRRR